MKDLKDCVNAAIEEAVKTRKATNVNIHWSKGIPVKKFEEDYLNASEEEVAETKNVIYIFLGEKKGQIGVDAGQTSRAVEVRIHEHINNRDYLEGYPMKQKVFCGKITAEIDVNRDLLEQVEGVIIQYIARHMDGESNYVVCNKSKTKGYQKVYKIQYVYNLDLSEELSKILPYCIYVE